MTGRARVLAWSGAVAGAGISVGLILVAVLADLDTAGQIAGIAGAIIGLAGLGVSLWALIPRPHVQPAAGPTTTASGERSVAAGGRIGMAATGDQSQVAPTGLGSAPPASPPSPIPAGGTVEASGGRSIAAGGDIGTAVTGDSTNGSGAS
ncbi:hypothetical protein GCM10010219_67040 [Streptomyces netropsis]|nr:hypothetical protein GCM10010219_67040 [Streptomyces netropsis]